jgi:hypothetical protein
VAGDLICDILRLLPGTRQRQYWTYLLLVPRKNSKSLLGAGLAIDGILDEPGAEVYSCAADKDQAKLIFGEVRAAVEMSPELDAKKGGLLKVYRDAIEYPATGAVYRALSSDAFTKEGLNPSRVLFDELHAQPTDELWNVMNQGSDTRAQPLIIAIRRSGSGRRPTARTRSATSSTSTPSRSSPARSTTPVRRPDLRDQRPGPGLQLPGPPVWEQANPAYGDFLDPEKMAAVTRKISEPDFKTKRLNIWVTQAKVWLPDGVWEKCEDASQEIPDGVEVCLGFDGSFNNDSTALVVARPGEELVFDPADPEHADLDEDERDRLAAELNAGLRLPHLDVVQAWERPKDAPPDWAVPILEVEAAIRAACRRWTGAGDRVRPGPLGAHLPGPGGRGPAGRGVPAVPAADGAGHPAVLRGRDEPHDHALR